MKLSELSQKIKKANDSLKEFSDSCNELSKTMLRPAGIQKKEKNNVRCPKCGNLNVAPIGESKKGFSVGKAIGGGVLTGGLGIGTMAGFIGKKRGNNFYCQDCGNIYTVKYKK